MSQTKKYQYKDCLTNEALFQQTKESQFDVVNRAIKIAEHMVRSGKVLDSASDNVSYDVLSTMADKGLNTFQEDHQE